MTHVAFCRRRPCKKTMHSPNILSKASVLVMLPHFTRYRNLIQPTATECCRVVFVLMGHTDDVPLIGRLLLLLLQLHYCSCFFRCCSTTCSAVSWTSTCSRKCSPCAAVTRSFTQNSVHLTTTPANEAPQQQQQQELITLLRRGRSGQMHSCGVR